MLFIKSIKIKENIIYNTFKLSIMKKHFVQLLLLVVFFCGCTGDNEPQNVSFSTNILEVDSEGGSVEFEITANCTWTISVDNSDIKLPVTSGNGDYSSSLTISKNDEYESRVFTITLTSEDGTSISTTRINQKAKAGIEVPDYIQVPSEGGTFEIEVKTNISEIELDAPEWITFVSSRALTKYTYKFTAELNETGKTRIGNIKFTGKGLSPITKIEQPTVPIPISSLSISQGNYLLLDTNDIIKLTTTHTPENATDTQLEWSSSNPSIASVNKDGELTPLTTGTCTIIVKNPHSGLSASILIEVKIKITSLKPKNYDIYGWEYSHEWWPGRKEIIYVNYSPDNAYIGDLYAQSQNTSICTTDGRTIIASSINRGKTTIDIIDPYSGISTFATVTVQDAFSYTGFVGSTIQSSSGGFETSYGGAIYSNNPNDKIEIIGLSMTDKDNYLKFVPFNINGNSSNKVSFYTDRFNTMEVFGIKETNTGAKFSITYTVNGKRIDEELEVKTGTAIKL